MTQNENSHEHCWKAESIIEKFKDNELYLKQHQPEQIHHTFQNRNVQILEEVSSIGTVNGFVKLFHK